MNATQALRESQYTQSIEQKAAPAIAVNDPNYSQFSLPKDRQEAIDDFLRAVEQIPQNSASEQSQEVAHDVRDTLLSDLFLPSLQVKGEREEFDKEENLGRIARPNPPTMPEIMPEAVSQVALSQLVIRLKGLTADLESMLDQYSDLATINKVEFAPTNARMKSVREAVWSIFNATGKFIGRNSVEARTADAELIIARLRKDKVIGEFSGGRGSEPEKWVTDCVAKNLDPDLASSAFDVGVYRHTYNSFYTKINDWRSLGKIQVAKFYSSRRQEK